MFGVLMLLRKLEGVNGFYELIHVQYSTYTKTLKKLILFLIFSCEFRICYGMRGGRGANFTVMDENASPPCTEFRL